MDDETRTRTAAFDISARFDGRTYRSYRTDARGILSFGRFNFTLASGALGQIVDAYLAGSESPDADALRPYQERIHEADASLRDDEHFRDLLRSAASDPLMQQAQDDEATARYWESVKRVAISPRGLDCPLSWALLFDMGITLGIGDGLLRMVEEEFGLAPRANIKQTELDEQTLIQRVAQRYKQAIDRKAIKEQRPDLRTRGEFWLNLVQQGDWGLQGDDNGNVMVKGRPIQVRATVQAQLSNSLDPTIFYVTPTAERVRVRDAPLEGQIVGILSPGDLAEVLDPYDEAAPRIAVQGEWLRVRTPDGIEGYTAAWFYKVHQKPDSLQLDDAPSMRVIALVDAVRLRTWPVDGKPLAAVSRGDVLDVLEPYSEAITKIGGHSEWLHVRTSGGITGYTAAWFYQLYEKRDPTPQPPPARPRVRQTGTGTPPTPEPAEIVDAQAQPASPEPEAQTVPEPEVQISPETAEMLEIPAEPEAPPVTEPPVAEVIVATDDTPQKDAPPESEIEEAVQAESLPAAPAEPDLRHLYITPTDNRIRIRATPVDGEPVAVVLSGQVIEVLDPYAEAIRRVGVEGEWLHIRTADDIEGYTAAWFYIVYEGPLASMPDTDLLQITPNEDLIRVRAQPGDGNPIELVSRGDVLSVLEYPDEAAPKIGAEDEWLRVRTPSGVDGYVATRFFRLFDGPLPGWRIDANITGVNIDLYCPQAQPRPEDLGQIGWLRLPYNVSLNPDLPVDHSARYGNTDLDAAYQRYQPLIVRYIQAGFKIMLVLNHQTYGEGTGYNWQDMNTERWQDLSDKFAYMAGRIASQYRGMVAAYQIWDGMDGASPTHAAIPLPPEDYAYMLFKSISAIRNADRKVLIITGGHTAGPAEGVAYARQTLDLLPEHAHPSGIAFHPYGRGDARSHVIFRAEGHIDDAVNAYAGLMPGYPVWITEWGVLNQPTETPETVAQYAEEFVQRLKLTHAHKIAAAIWFPWVESMGKGYGLVDARGKMRFDLTERYIYL